MPWALWAPDPPPPDAWAFGDPWDGLTASLDESWIVVAGARVPLSASPAADVQPIVAGSFQPLFDSDFYNRLHLSITVLALGNVVGDQVRTVSVWNAYSYGVTMTALSVLNGEGIEISGQPAPPLVFGPLQERIWSVVVQGEGPPTISTLVTWTFSGGVQLRLSITGNRITPWSWSPDWARGILEALEWRTDVIEAEQSDEQRIGMRLTPRQTWEFTATATGTARQAMEAAILGWGARIWALPLWPHGAQLQAPAAEGATELEFSTFGRELAAGGLVLIIGSNALEHEVAEIDSIEADRLILKRPLARAWSAAAAVFPAKAARLSDASMARFTGDCADAQVRFEIAQANPHDAAITLPEYRGYAVLEDSPDWASAPVLAPSRKIGEVDNNLGVPVQRDRSGLPSMRQVLRWAPHGRAATDALRRLLYALDGRRVPLWLPSNANDITLAVVASSGASNIDIVACGYTAYLSGMPGRRDIRIESEDGIQYRRITGSVDLGNGNERIGLDEPLEFTLSPAAGEVWISFLSLFRLDSDRIEWAWWSGDHGADNAHADVPTPLRTFRNDV